VQLLNGNCHPGLDRLGFPRINNLSQRLLLRCLKFLHFFDFICYFEVFLVNCRLNLLQQRIGGVSCLLGGGLRVAQIVRLPIYIIQDFLLKLFEVFDQSLEL
jgi:hypothetical protein